MKTADRLEDSTPLFSACVGAKVFHGSGWLQPVVLDAPWPFARLTVNRESLCVALPWLGSEVIRWVDVKAVEHQFGGFVVRYEVGSEQRELNVVGLWIWSLLIARLTAHGLAPSDLMPSNADADDSIAAE